MSGWRYVTFDAQGESASDGLADFNFEQSGEPDSTKLIYPNGSPKKTGDRQTDLPFC